MKQNEISLLKNKNILGIIPIMTLDLVKSKLKDLQIEEGKKNFQNWIQFFPTSNQFQPFTLLKCHTYRQTDQYRGQLRHSKGYL